MNPQDLDDGRGVSFRTFQIEPYQEAPATCPRCSAARLAVQRDGAARFQCGTTTMMMERGIHIDDQEPAARARAIALYRQALHRDGARDPML